MDGHEIDNKRDYSIIIIIIAAVSVYKDISHKHNKYVNINSLVNKSYTSSKGYDSDIAKHMSKVVFDNSNGYIMYELYQCKKPIKISFKSTEVNQHKINGKIFAYMLYDFEMSDADGKLVTGSWQCPVVSTVTGTNDNLYIEKAQEFPMYKSSYFI
ncbi:hypothetical protein [Clostridium estertheticum]|uniref:hypothetical protein n=1 Tax=Clostridium estertheticum TaxID=238834 RepID=UPI001C7D0902|nr:hypothetical protein [Clostridium estertheticum]MBX4260403.1 hypothetical protein [Clostridium estertheticum]